jgi:hypothetical protein
MSYVGAPACKLARCLQPKNIMKKKELFHILHLLDDIRRLSHRVDHVSDAVTQNLQHVENMLVELNDITAIRTVCDEKSRSLTRKLKKMHLDLPKV